ncbi:hypothetical protein ACU4HD_33750 [Cupriavidus basilensis]
MARAISSLHCFNCSMISASAPLGGKPRGEGLEPNSQAEHVLDVPSRPTGNKHAAAGFLDSQAIVNETLKRGPDWRATDAHVLSNVLFLQLRASRVVALPRFASSAPRRSARCPFSSLFFGFPIPGVVTASPVGLQDARPRAAILPNTERNILRKLRKY